MTIKVHRLHVLKTGVRASFASHEAHHHLQWHRHSLFETAGWTAQFLERALLQTPAWVLLLYLWWLNSSRSFCCSAGFLAAWKAGSDAVFWYSLTSSSSSEDPCSLVPQTVTPSLVPNHAEGIQVMPHAWGSSHTMSACSMWQGCAPFTATQQLQPTSTCKHVEASFTWCLVRPLAQ